MEFRLLSLCCFGRTSSSSILAWRRVMRSWRARAFLAARPSPGAAGTEEESDATGESSENVTLFLFFEEESSSLLLLLLFDCLLG